MKPLINRRKAKEVKLALLTDKRASKEVRLSIKDAETYLNSGLKKNIPLAYSCLDEAIEAAQDSNDLGAVVDAVVHSPLFESDLSAVYRYGMKCSDLCADDSLICKLHPARIYMLMNVRKAEKRCVMGSYIDSLNYLNPVITAIEENLMPFRDDDTRKLYSDALRVRAQCSEQLGLSEGEIKDLQKLDKEQLLRAVESMKLRNSVKIYNITQNNTKKNIHIANSVIQRANIG